MALKLCLLLMVASFVRSDDIDRRSRGSFYLKAIKEMSSHNNNKTDSLNLPANASSIRHNITDTFSCENRTYGYYADVDNECQIFHVCLPSQSPGGRNVTYRWSFICPNETIFNQVVLTCTRPMDSIPCEESPDYYYLNDEIGKVNKTEKGDKTDKDDKPEKGDKPVKGDKPEKEKEEKKDKESTTEKPIDKKRKPPRGKDAKRNENIIMQALFNSLANDDFKSKLEDVEFDREVEESPMLLEAVIDSVEPVPEVEEEKEVSREEDLDRIVMERNMGNYKEMRRGGFRFKGDV